jgi:3-phytase
MKKFNHFICSSIFILLVGCNYNLSSIPLKPIVVTKNVFGDSDDPAIWINEKYPDSSLILGTDKDKENGGVYIFDLKGNIDSTKSKFGMKRVNNIDIANHFTYLNKDIAIAVATERDNHAIRIFSVPQMEVIDGGGIKVFSDDSLNLPMGIALYTNPQNKKVYSIVGRKNGPKEGYLYQYYLYDSSGVVKSKLVRKFGIYSGKKEIESIAVDNELGYVYYSDEQYGIRKYYANPDSSNNELAIFGKNDFKEDNEGISIYKNDDQTGYIIVSDQSAHSFNVYQREGIGKNKHQHELIGKFEVSAKNSDGSDINTFDLPGFNGGIFVVMSDNKTFHYYSWQQIKNKLKMDR